LETAERRDGRVALVVELGFFYFKERGKRMKLYTHKTRLLSRCFMKTVIVLILTIVVLVNMTGKAKADIIAL
jgi:hypothetical protein